jgi:spore coat polysaccharide biosynthesis protein SpsF
MLVVVAARSSSKRLPRKVLAEIGGIPSILLQVRRIQMWAEAHVVVGTSLDPSDDELVETLLDAGTEVCRGDLNDVAGRLLAIGKSYGAPEFLRVSGDSPLIDPEVLKQVANEYFESHPELATNVWPRTYPKGQSAEIIQTSLLEKNIQRMSSQNLEHVTQFFYENQHEYSISNVSNPHGDQSSYSTAVDTSTDLELCRRRVLALGFEEPFTSYLEVW